MSTIASAPAQAQSIIGQSRASGLVATMKRWWMAYITWRIEHAAIAHLSSMSDRELKDIGLIRSEIAITVTGAPRDRPFARCY